MVVKNKIISIFLIITGLMVIAYPKLSDMILDHRQEQLMTEWEESLALIDDNTGPEEEAVPVEDQVELEGPLEAQVAIEDRREEFEEKGIEGMLSINKIDLNLPILKGSSKANLRKSVASVDKTGSLGQVGNYAIAGHRNRTYGSIFNRLDEVDLGDKIGLSNGAEQFNYEVVDKLYVKPEETWVLKGNQADKEVTLITCHPQVNPTHRLIIKGKIIE